MCRNLETFWPMHQRNGLNWRVFSDKLKWGLPCGLESLYRFTGEAFSFEWVGMNPCQTRWLSSQYRVIQSLKWIAVSFGNPCARTESK